MATAVLLAALALSASAQTVRYIHTDSLGSVAVVTDQSRNVVERREYEPYGLQLTPAIKDGPGYTGHVQDATTGLTYMQQRYYDPQVGLFLSVDPVTAYGSGDYRNFNRYAYAYNSPYQFSDPDGRNPAAGAAIGCAITGPACPAGATVGAIIGTAVLVVGGVIAYNEISDQSQNSGNASPPLPGGLVGADDGKSGQQGDRINNGPLAPENGGTGEAESDFDRLTGGDSSPAPESSRLPEGSRVGENGVIYRPPRGNSGPRIDIPANGKKPHETLHYPPPPPPPPPKSP